MLAYHVTYKALGSHETCRRVHSRTLNRTKMDQRVVPHVPAVATSASQPCNFTRRHKGPRLLMVSQPPDIFYKDEGGKSNFMAVSVKFDESSGTFPGEFALTASLHFESGVRVSEDSILSMVGNQYEPTCITSATDVATIKFRVEKVSRRKDGQKFKLFVGPDVQLDPFASNIMGVFCNPISVLSKRKSPAQRQDSGTKRARVDMQELEDRLSAKMDGLQSTCSDLIGLIRSQNERMVRVETSLEHVVSQLAASSRPSELVKDGMKNVDYSSLRAEQILEQRKNEALKMKDLAKTEDTSSRNPFVIPKFTPTSDGQSNVASRSNDESLSLGTFGGSKFVFTPTAATPSKGALRGILSSGVFEFNFFE